MNGQPTREMIEEYAEEGIEPRKWEATITIENTETGQTWDMGGITWGNYDSRHDAIDEMTLVALEMMQTIDPELIGYMKWDMVLKSETAPTKQPTEYSYNWTDDWGTWIYYEGWETIHPS